MSILCLNHSVLQKKNDKSIYKICSYKIAPKKNDRVPSW